MNRVRPYIPLIGFVLPTVVVGYGFVIPRSCIASVNGADHYLGPEDQRIWSTATFRVLPAELPRHEGR